MSVTFSSPNPHIEVYRKLLQTLIEPDDSTAVMNELNARLAQLKQYRINLFDITDKLFVRESDFKAIPHHSGVRIAQ